MTILLFELRYIYFAISNKCESVGSNLFFAWINI